jgi:TolB-like protein
MTRTFRLTTTLFAVAFIFLIIPLSSAAQEKIKVAVLPFDATTGIEKGTAELVTEEVLNRMRQKPNIEVISLEEIDKLITLEQKKQLLGCTDDSCLLEAAGALGVDKLLMCKMGRIGSQYAFSLKLLDVHHAKVDRQAYERISSTTGEEAFTVLARLVDQLFAEQAQPKEEKTAAEQPATSTAQAKASTETASQKKSRISPWVWVAGSVAVAALGAGVAFGIMANSSVSKGNDLVAESTKGEVWYEDVKDQQDKADRNALISYIGFGLGGAAAITTVILIFTTGGKEEKTALAPFVVPDGGGVAFTTSF